VLRDSNDGFVIAERDLEIRGPGEVLGTKQTGLAEFKIADLVRDKAVVTQVRPVAKRFIEEHQDLAEKIITRWLPNKEQFAQA
jgi:ATP-dependent DNA helicase RecG